MQLDTINFIRYRSKGNCFVNCLMQALTNLDNGGSSKKPRSELEIFNVETLYSTKPEDEFRPALNYLINNKYKVKIIDPDPCRDNNWGNNLTYADIQKHNYKIEEVGDLSNKGWQVIISTAFNSNPHAILVTNNYVYDPINENEWEKVKKKSMELLLDFVNKINERFLIAIKK